MNMQDYLFYGVSIIGYILTLYVALLYPRRICVLYVRKW